MRVMFVDDQPNVLAGLRRMLRSLHSEWEMDFIDGGDEALALLDRENYDVVVTDMRMPGMNGAQLLTEVMNRRPGTVRIILSGQADAQSVLQAVSPAHLYLSKPCEADALKAAVGRALQLRETLKDAMKGIVSRVTRLPSAASLYQQLIDELDSEEPSLRRVGELVAQDVAMTAKLLQLVSSSFFGAPRVIHDPAHAASLLGLAALKPLVHTAEIFQPYSGGGSLDFSIAEKNAHSSAVALLAQRIALDTTGERSLADDALLAGMVHDVGQLIFAKSLPLEYQEALTARAEREIPLIQAESDRLGANHADAGAYLLGLWGVSDRIIDAVAHHHHPDRSPHKGFTPLSAVHLADALVCQAQPSGETATDAQLHRDYVRDLGLDDKLSAWRDLAEEVLVS
jgi:HD-like signal output (HDOD) protein